MFPNPTCKYATVELPEYLVTATKGHGVSQMQYRPLKGEVQLSLINLSGQIVKTDIVDASERNRVIDVSRLSSGIYMVQLTQRGKVIASGKVIVAK